MDRFIATQEVLDKATIESRQRELAKRYHPDRAGRDAARAKVLTAKMSAINQSANILLESLPRR